MTFWDTVLGHRLAETLINYLPDIAREKRQTVKKVKNSELFDELEDAISKGYQIDHLTLAGSVFVVVYSK